MSTGCKTRAVFLLWLMVGSTAWADRVIMKDGKIYEGHIMGESQSKLLISTTLGQPKFLEMRDVMTVVREDHAPAPSVEPQRYFSFEGDVASNFYLSRGLDFPPAASVRGSAGFRIHPMFEVGVDLNWTPGVSGDLQIQGEQTRSYEHFWLYGGGFWSRIYPFAKQHWIIEPYLTGGYGWDRLLPKGSDDYLSGHTWRIGVGCQRVIRGSLYGHAALLYNHTVFDSVEFLDQSGDLSQGIANHSLMLMLGVAYHVD